jgi:hypothetical protein
MRWVRTWLPLAIIVAGVASIVATGGAQWGFEGGMLIISAGLSVWLLNFFFRVGVKGDLERDREDRARDFFDEHGYWPDEAPPAPAEPTEPGGSVPPTPHAGPLDRHSERPRAHPERPLRRPHRRGP